jgi:ferredoxin
MMAGNVLGKGYTAGVGMSIGTAFGRIAGTEAARAAIEKEAAYATLEALTAKRRSPGAGDPDPALTANETEVGRQMQICNACRYCEGFCAVFPAMTRRLEFGKADINYLANLCHNCGACLHACQYAPPHEFAVNVPQAMAQVRQETYSEYAWPPALGALYRATAWCWRSPPPAAGAVPGADAGDARQPLARPAGRQLLRRLPARAAGGAVRRGLPVRRAGTGDGRGALLAGSHRERSAVKPPPRRWATRCA